MNTFLETNSAVSTFRPDTGLTPIGPVLADILTDALLAACFTAAPCSVCSASDLPTIGPTYHDSETGGQYCLGCLELACETLSDGPEDAEVTAYAEERISARRTARTAA